MNERLPRSFIQKNLYLRRNYSLTVCSGLDMEFFDLRILACVLANFILGLTCEFVCFS